MQERDKLTTMLDKLNENQLRIVMRLAEAMAEEERADPMHDAGDVRMRYAQFKRWCDDRSLDLNGIEAWIEESRKIAARVMA
jgi:hypothetical protein